MKYIFWFCIVCFLWGCASPFAAGGDGTIIKKQVRNESTSMEWHTYSSSFSSSRNYITLRKGVQMDTVCVSDNIADIKVGNGNFIIGFYGTSKLYTKVITVLNKSFGEEIIIDTTYVLNWRKSSSEGRRLVSTDLSGL